MAELTAVLASTHQTSYIGATSRPWIEHMPLGEVWKRKVEAYGGTLAAASPDVLIVVGPDRFNQHVPDDYPTFMIGNQTSYDAPEDRQVGLPVQTLRGHPDLSDFILHSLRSRGLDFWSSQDLKLTSSITCQIAALCPGGDLPVVPIYTNIFAPTVLPSPKSFWDLGCAIRQVIDEYPADIRIAAIGAGRLSVDIEALSPFGEGSRDREFDARAIKWLATGDIDAILEHVTHLSMLGAGNATHGFMELILMLGIAGTESAAYVDQLDLSLTTEMFLTWYPSKSHAHKVHDE